MNDTFPTLNQKAYYGLAGEVVNAVMPYTEAAPEAVLGTFLTFYGNTIGRNAYVPIGATRHYGNEFLVIVGKTARARKGTSKDAVMDLFNKVDVEWTKNRVKSGLASGEGIIFNVRDGAKDDPGEPDKRLMAIEGEFARVLSVMARQGNTLSTVLRDSWDHGRLSNLTKNSPDKCDNAHVSLLVHITIEELKQKMAEVDTWNGFANRFLWFAVKRSKFLDDPQIMPDSVMNPLVQKLKAAVDFGRKPLQVVKDEKAKALWREVYPVMTTDKPGLLGAITARCEAHALRLALIYALLDCSPVIGIDHLLAAIAIIDYVEETVKYVFGDATGDRVADKILEAVEEEPRDQDWIRRVLFARNISAERIAAALNVLVDMGKIECTKLSGTGGRPKTVYHLPGQVVEVAGGGGPPDAGVRTLFV